MAASDCVEEVLLVNGWSSEQGLINVTAEDKKTLLMVSLAKKLNSEVHSFVDLASRYIQNWAFCIKIATFWAKGCNH